MSAFAPKTGDRLSHAPRDILLGRQGPMNGDSLRSVYSGECFHGSIGCLGGSILTFSAGGCATG
jgi:hypothetical protein